MVEMQWLTTVVLFVLLKIENSLNPKPTKKQTGKVGDLFPCTSKITVFCFFCLETPFL
jgi:hypothetical protein